MIIIHTLYNIFVIHCVLQLHPLVIKTCIFIVHTTIARQSTGRHTINSQLFPLYSQNITLNAIAFQKTHEIWISTSFLLTYISHTI